MYYYLISSIGAIHNGIEPILMSAKDNLGPEFDLLAESSHNEANRIKFFGVAFGNSLNTHEISSKNAFQTSNLLKQNGMGRNWTVKLKLTCP